MIHFKFTCCCLISPPHMLLLAANQNPPQAKPPLQASPEEARRKAHTSVGYVLQLSPGYLYPGLYTTINNYLTVIGGFDFTWRKTKEQACKGRAIEEIWTCVFFTCENGTVGVQTSTTPLALLFRTSSTQFAFWRKGEKEM